MTSSRFRRRLGALGTVSSIAIVAALAAHTCAFAGAGSLVGPSVDTLSSDITFSSAAVTTKPTREALTTYAGFSFGSIKNDGGNTVNNIRITFNRDTSISGIGVATFSSAEGGSCAPQLADPKLIDCAIGQLQAGESSSGSLRVYLKIPTAAAGSTGSLQFAGKLYYAEGTGGVPNSKPDNSVNDWSAPLVALGTKNPLRIKTVAPTSASAQLLFTGVGGISGVDGDKFTTSVSIPANTPSVVAEIVESELASAECSSFAVCYESVLTIPGTFDPYLSIVLRMDAANVVNGTKIESVTIMYDEGHDVTLCASPTTPRTDGKPCIAKRVYYKNKGVTGWTPELDGDFEWTLINPWNGTYRIL